MSNEKISNKNDDRKSYQEMLKSVEEIVEQINEEDCDLDQMVAKVEEGYGLIRNLRLRLSQTREKVETLQLEHSNIDKLGENSKE